MSKPRTPFRADHSLSVRPYDRVASGLIATIVLVSTLVTLMLAVWFTSMLHWGENLVRVEWKFGGDQGEVQSEAADAAPLLPPDVQPEMDVTLQAVTNLLSQQAALVASEVSSLDGLSVGDRDGRKPGSRPSGWGPDPRSARPPWERWEIQFSSSSLDEYRKQLDFFGVELAAFGGSGGIDYATKFVQTKPARRVSDDPRAEQRLRFSWRQGTFLQYDRTLLELAGIPTDNRVTCHFYPDEMTQQLLRLEAASGRPVEEVLRTLFGVRRQPAGGYEFYVISQSYLPSSLNSQ